LALITICGHTFEEARLPEEPVILDAGSSGFGFTNEMFRLRPAARVIALDPIAERRKEKPGEQFHFMQRALVGHSNPQVPFVEGGTGSHVAEKGKLVTACISIQALMRWFEVHHWDLVKLDVEGSEFPILENWPGPIASQISVEFHDYLDPAKWGPDYFSDLWKKLPCYRAIQHEATSQRPGVGHWDTLLECIHEVDRTHSTDRPRLPG